MMSDTVVSQRTVSEELSQSMKLDGIHEYISVFSLQWTTKGAVLPVMDQRQFDSFVLGWLHHCEFCFWSCVFRCGVFCGELTPVS